MSERVVICGSRHWIDSDAIQDRVCLLPAGSVVIHGGACGADALAGRWAQFYGHDEVVFPADWEGNGKAAGPMRNQRMVDDGRPDRVIAFRLAGRSPGTDDMIRRAVRAGIPVEVVTG